MEAQAKRDRTLLEIYKMQVLKAEREGQRAGGRERLMPARIDISLSATGAEAIARVFEDLANKGRAFATELTSGAKRMDAALGTTHGSLREVSGLLCRRASVPGSSAKRSARSPRRWVLPRRDSSGWRSASNKPPPRWSRNSRKSASSRP